MNTDYWTRKVGEKLIMTCFGEFPGDKAIEMVYRTDENKNLFILSNKIIGRTEDFDTEEKRENYKKSQEASAPLVSPWFSECAVCGAIYQDHCGSTPCCGAVSYLIETPITHLSAHKGLSQETLRGLIDMAEKAYNTK